MYKKMGKRSSRDPPSTDKSFASGGMREEPRSVSTPSGAHLGTIPMERSVKVYPISETELDTIEVVTGQVNRGFAIASAAGAIAFTLFLENQVSPEATPVGELLLRVGPLVGVIVAAIAGFSGLAARHKRSQIIRRIKRESTQLTESTQRASVVGSAERKTVSTS